MPVSRIQPPIHAVPVYRTSSYVFNDTEHAANLFGAERIGEHLLSNYESDSGRSRATRGPVGGRRGCLGLVFWNEPFSIRLSMSLRRETISSRRTIYMEVRIRNSMTFFQTWELPSSSLIPISLPASPRRSTKIPSTLFCETVSNPGVDIADLEAIAKIAHDNGLPLIVDSTFSTPYLTRPIDFGADIVVHSLTKWFGGHGTGIGGVVVDSGKFNWANGKFALYDEPDSSYHGLRWGHDLPEPLAPLAFILRMRTVPLRNLGACLSPDNAWIFCKVLRRCLFVWNAIALMLRQLRNI